MICRHETFEAWVDVARITDGEDGPVRQYSADVRVHCSQCGLVFRFKGMPGGLDPDRPTTSFLRDEARLPIEPGDIRLN